MLELSRELIGRKSERASLAAAIDAARRGACRVTLISGPAGIGKSALVHDVAAAAQGVVFVHGKFDQHQRDIPYSTLGQAFRELLRWVLAADPASLAAWRERLGAALGTHGALVAGLVPEITLVLGELAPAVQLDPGEARDRFRLVLQAFVRACASAQQPLVLLLDDMQWADAATLALLQPLLAGDGVAGLSLMLAFRDNEVGAAHPFALLREALHRDGVDCAEVVLGPLDEAGVAAHLAATLYRSGADALQLAQLVVDKTAGNPFFVNEFVKTLVDRQLLARDCEMGGWTWSLADIGAERVTDNLVALLVERIDSLEPNTRAALIAAAALGNRFSVSQWTAMVDRPESDGRQLLAPALKLGLVMPQGSNTAGMYSFAHDRIQQAAYSLVPAPERAALHRTIGLRLLRALPAPEGALLFDIVNQLNAGLELAVEPAEGLQLALLNVAAGNHAKASIAWDSAARHYATACALYERLDAAEGLHQPADAKRAAARFRLRCDHTECEFLAGRLDQAAALFRGLLGAAPSDVERAEVYTLWNKLLQVAGDFGQALTLGIEAVALFGIVLPATDQNAAALVEAERAQLAARLALLGDVDLATLPLAEDARTRAVIALLTSLGPPSYMARPALFPLIVLKAVNLSLEHGNCEASCFAYSMYSMLLVSVFDDIDAGFRFSEMCIQLNDRLGDAKLKGTVLHIHGSHIHCWRHAYRDCFGFIERGFAACAAAGDVTMANYNGYQASWQYLFGSRRLADAAPVLDKYLAFARLSRHQSAWWTIRAQQRLLQVLQGEPVAQGQSLQLDGDGFDTEQALAALRGAGFAGGIAFVHIARLALGVIAGDFGSARVAAAAARAVIDAVPSLPIEADFVYYEALAIAASTSADTPADMAHIAAAEARLAAWAAQGPANFAHKYLLVRAERSRLAGDTLAAMRDYERAVATARDHGALHDAALGCETAARFYFAAGVDRGGVVGLRQAATWYREWGAQAKRMLLERRLLPQLHEASATLPTTDEPIDLRSVMKAAQAIARETDRERLLRSLMHNVMQLAGAQAGWLLLGGHDTMAVAVSAEVIGEHIEVRLGAPTAAPALPDSVLAFVERTREAVVLHDAAKSARFSSEAALVTRRVRSLMCLPVQQAADGPGLLYLENNLAAGAFTPERVLSLELLAGQIAIALDNARLVEELTDSVLRTNLAASAARLLMWTLSADLDLRWGEGSADHAPIDQALEGLHADDRLRVRGQLLDALRQGTELDIEYRFVRPRDGAPRTMIARGRASRDAEGRPLRLSGVILDVTDRRDAEAQRRLLLLEQAARAEADTASRAKDEFLATLAHELRNPLAPIVHGLALMKVTSAPNERLRDMMERQARQLVRLVDDLLEVSRLTHGKLVLQRSRVRLRDVLDQALDAAQPALQARRHVLALTHCPDDLEIDADAARLAQVIGNLLDNACKYCPEGGRIELEVTRQYGQALIRVADNGSGIEAELLPRVFDLFAQARHGDARGLGIGLSLVQRLVQMHGGSVSAHSAGPGRGSEFVVRLPLAAVADSTDAPAEPVHPRPAAAGRRVLVVDDNRDAADSLGALLGCMGSEARIAYDGPGALDAVHHWQPEVVLLDLGMPGMDGYEVARRIRASWKDETIRLIALTGWGQQQDRERTREAGFDHHLVKPVEMAALQALLAPGQLSAQ